MRRWGFECGGVGPAGRQCPGWRCLPLWKVSELGTGGSHFVLDQEIVAFADQNTHYIKEDEMQLMEFYYITSTAKCAPSRTTKTPYLPPSRPRWYSASSFESVNLPLRF